MYEISNHFYTDNGLVKEDIDPPPPVDQVVSVEAADVVP